MPLTAFLELIWARWSKEICPSLLCQSQKSSFKAEKYLTLQSRLSKSIIQTLFSLNPKNMQVFLSSIIMQEVEQKMTLIITKLTYT